MKKFQLLMMCVALSGFIFSGCDDKNKEEEPQPVRVQSVDLDASILTGYTMEIGSTFDISTKFTVYPSDAADKTATYSSDATSIATIDASGKITAVAVGKCGITVTVDTRKAAFTLTVAEKVIRVTSVEFDADIKDGEELTVEETLDISEKFTVNPDNATNKGASYHSSDELVATVSDAGEITALAAGTTTITVIVDEKSDTFELTVKNKIIRVESVTLAADIKEGHSLVVEATLDISGKFTVAPENATDKTATYASATTSVATITDAGVITAVSAGTSVITVTVDEKTASFTLTVTDNFIAVESVEFAADVKDGYMLALDETLDISEKFTITPADATNKTASYASSEEEVATVSEVGGITPLKEGETDITVTVDGQSATFTLTVVRVKLTSVTTDLSGTMYVPVGATNRIWQHINVVPVPTDLKDKYITFSSSDESIAVVDQYGVIIGKSTGDATITIEAKNDATIKATLSVKVVAATYYPRTSADDGFDAETMTTWTMALTSGTANNNSQGDALTRPFDGVWGSSNANEDACTLSINATPWKNGTIDRHEFIVDMKVSQVVNVFKIIHRSGPNTNRMIRYYGFDEIAGSNDEGEDKVFTPIATMVEVADAQSPLKVAISETTFENSTAYRYIRFTAKTIDFCRIKGIANYPGVSQLLNADRTPDNDEEKKWGNGGGGVQNHADNAGSSNQIQELYLGKYE